MGLSSAPGYKGFSAASDRSISDERIGGYDEPGLSCSCNTNVAVEGDVVAGRVEAAVLWFWDAVDCDTAFESELGGARRSTLEGC